MYYSAHNDIKEFDFDGAGSNIKTRKFKLTEEDLWGQAVSCKDNIQEANRYLNYLAYLQVPLLGDLRSEWDIRCHATLLTQILEMNDKDFEVLLFYMTLLSRGIFFLAKHIGNEGIHKNWVHENHLCYSIVFMEAFNAEMGIVGAVMPERIPICHPQNEQLQEFKYRQYLLLHQIWDIDSILKQNRNYKLHLTDELRADPDKYQAFSQYNVQLRHDAPKNELHVHVQYKHLFTGDFQSYQIRPLKIFKWMVKENPVASFTFHAKTRRWLYNPSKTQNSVDQETLKKEMKVQNKVLTQMDKEQTSKKLVQILDLMPTLQIKLSAVQQKVVASNQNLLCLGRSGTGKTTTSVLRLFAQEVLYSILKKHETDTGSKKPIEEGDGASSQKKQLIKAKDLEKNTGMKMVFITASPVLTNEVRRFYSSIKGKLIALLKTRDAKIKERKKKQVDAADIFVEITEEETQELLNEALAEQKDSDKKALEVMNDYERKEMLEFIQIEERNLVDDLAIESEMNLPNSFDDLKPSQFPLFVTVKRLIYMMDACLNYSFFSRDHNNNIIGLDQNLGWHNESKGVMMINHYFKESIDYDQQLAKFGKEILEIDKEAEIMNDEEEIDDDLGQNFKIIIENDQKGKNGFKVSQFTNRQTTQSAYFIEKQQLSYEVDYEIFETKFWPKIANRRCLVKLSPTLVWTEIYSVIKGGMKSGTYYMGYLPKHNYVKSEGSEFLNLNERRLIYFLFLEYEKWKASVNAYDFMDVVNHLQKRLWFGDTLKRMSIDYLMVDEVQDLTPKTLQTLLRLTSHKVFFAGDTAQTIAKGVGARFLDLRNIFLQLDFKVPQIIQLTRNYRSHGRILDLANSVVTLIELLFPKTIDKLVKEDSDIDGLKPLVIMPLDPYHLRTFFTGTTVTQHSGGKIASPQFGCNQVLIVRDQQAKDHLPDVFANMLCLTVYEAKGLEFDDVILYNFFHLGDVQKSQWKLLNDIELEEVQRIKVTEQLLLDFDSLDAEKSNMDSLMRELKKQERADGAEVEYETEIGLRLKKHRDEVYRKFSMLCVEMKFLYVAITRPKRRLIIYDDAVEGRRPIQRYWEKLNVVEVVTKEQIKHPETLNESVKDIFMSGQMVNERSSIEQWRLQGIKLFKKKYYDAAVKCFENSDDKDLVLRCHAYKEADAGSSKSSSADSDAWRVQVFKHLPRVEKQHILKDVKKQRAQASKHFESAGHLFEQISMLKHAASCFYTGKNYQKAGAIFESLGQFGQAAECYLMTGGQLSKAAQLYEKANLVSKAIECYESNGDWEQLLHCLHRNKDFFKSEDRQALINKYVPVALNSLYKLYSQSAENGEDLDADDIEDNRGKLQEMKIRMKYQKQVSQAVIAEEDELSNSEEEEEDAPEEQEENPQEEEKVEEEEKKEVEEEEEDVNSDIEVMEEEEGFDLLNEVFQLKKHKSQNEEQQQLKLLEDADQSKAESSFEVIDTSSNTSKMLQTKAKQGKEEEAKKQPEQDEQILDKEDFEHLSQYDPDDEFLRSNKSVSIIESLLSKKSVSQTSDFSIISNARSHKVQSLISVMSSQPNNVAFVESNRDIYAEDVITQKIIYYISLFSEDVSTHLQKIRSKKVLFSSSKEVDQQKQEELFILDLDDIDNNFVNLILDVLEYYELFRLCLMLCNRYHMSERLGRYLVSVCSKYSNMHMHRFNIKLLRTNLSLNEIWLNRQRFASIIAHEAIHNVFTLLEPAFLSIKRFDEPMDSSVSLGMETYRAMLDLGFWKKLVYIGLDSRRAMEICYKFFDLANFQILQQSLQLEPEQKAQVDQWHMQLVLKEYWHQCSKKIRSMAPEDNLKVVLKGCKQNFVVSQDSHNKMVEQMTTLQQWMYSPARKVTDLLKPGKKIINEDQTKKLKDQVDKLNEDENYQVYEILEEQGIFDLKVDTYQKKFIALQFATLPGTQHFSKFLENIRTYYDKYSVEAMIKLYIKQIQRLNLDSRYLEEYADDALYSIFHVSSLHETAIKDDSTDSLFKHYKDGQYLLMSVHSPLLKDITAVQTSMDGFQMNVFLARKLTELRPRYFQLKNFRTAFIKEYKDFVAQFDQKKAYLNQNNEKGSQAGCFIIDMDAQFMMVPRTWIHKLLINKLLNLCISLAHELNHLHENQKNEEEVNDQEVIKENISLEENIDKKFDEMKTVQRVNQLAMESHKLHEPYVHEIERTEKKMMNQMMKNPDFLPLIESYRQKINFNPIKLNSITKTAQRTLAKPLNETSYELYLAFNFGILNKKKTIRNKSEVIQLGIKTFKDAMEVQISDIDDEEDWISRNLIMLIQSFANFVIIDEYEIMLELIKGEIKSLNQRNKNNPNNKDQQMKWLLSKFMICLDIHFYLKNGSIKMACESIFSFIDNFAMYLNNREKGKLIQTALYLIQLTKFGACYFPDYAIRFFDVTYDLNGMYYNNSLVIDILNARSNHGDEEGQESSVADLFETDERDIIEKVVDKDFQIEKIEDEKLYIRGLQQIVNLLKDINADVRSAYFKIQYIQMFNLLMSALVNDSKKSQQINDLLCNGFTLISESSYDEYFQQAGLIDFNYSNAQGLHELFKQFRDCEKEYKHQFFAPFSFGGHMLCFIDIKKCQGAEIQTKIQKSLDQAFFKESKILAQHLYLGQLLKRKIRQRRHIYLSIKRAKEYFTYEDQALSMDMNLHSMLPVDQLPSRQLLDLLILLQRKHQELRQFIVCKLAVNSLDIHYILAKANDLYNLQQTLLSQSIKFVKEKGQILSHFEDVIQGESELMKLMNDIRFKYLEIDTEIGQWMQQKAEPNLIEVERKSSKFKIKWQSLKIWDSKAQLQAIAKKKIMISGSAPAK